jgi:ADP-ribose pyrophosphatase
MSDLLLQATKFRVERRRYEIPGKGMVDRELVVHPGAVCILPIERDQTVIMIRNYRFAAGSELLELPAGTLEPGEEPAVCAARELEEETGYRAERIEPLTEFYTTPGFTDEYMYCFVATGLTETQQNLDDGEQIQVAKTSLDDALTACLDGRIRDAKTIAALQLFYCRQTRSA